MARRVKQFFEPSDVRMSRLQLLPKAPALRLFISQLHGELGHIAGIDTA